MTTAQETKEREAQETATRYSESWVGQDGREWREVKYWVGAGWTSALQVRVPGGNWQGW